jgi:hypothetical protein
MNKDKLENKIKLKDLKISFNNLRFFLIDPEYNLSDFKKITKGEDEAIKRFFKKEKNDENLINSLSSNGFNQYEDTIYYAINENNEKIVVEGNRRIFYLKILNQIININDKK